MTKYTSEKDTYRDNQILALLKQYNFINNNLTLPQNILEAACKLFITIKNAEDKKFVRRGNTRKGILGACIYAECIRAEITKTKSQIAELMQVEETHVTAGWNELLYYHNAGIIELPKNIEPYEAYFNTYFEIFHEIPITPYKAFAIDLLKKMQKHGVLEIQQCNNTTKCIGIMYYISQTWYPNVITHDSIQTRCGKISRATYLTVAQSITRNLSQPWMQKLLKKHELVTGLDSAV
jgi:transcription initiation factor TFIIIB Brf1 subunit/transcription initiation factor TFIIB